MKNINRLMLDLVKLKELIQVQRDHDAGSANATRVYRALLNLNQAISECAKLAGSASSLQKTELTLISSYSFGDKSDPLRNGNRNFGRYENVCQRLAVGPQINFEDVNNRIEHTTAIEPYEKHKYIMVGVSYSTRDSIYPNVCVFDAKTKEILRSVPAVGL